MVMLVNLCGLDVASNDLNSFVFLPPHHLRSPRAPQAFFERYGDMVRYSCAEKTREMVKSGENCPSGPHTIRANEPLQTYAVRWLTEQPGVSCVVADMETAKQVDDTALALPNF